ncbi:MAG: hypothetical protein SVP52_05295 [Chloroflexota bacterium]|nr:hypothetical protein [Chloroflexota bacterium]
MRNQLARTAFLILLLSSLVFSSVRSTNDIEGEDHQIVSFLLGLFTNRVTAQDSQIAYVATSNEECEGYQPNCYPNTKEVDGPDGAGTGLRDAVNALNPGDEIIILGTYRIKDHTVLIYFQADGLGIIRV